MLITDMRLMSIKEEKSFLFEHGVDTGIIHKQLNLKNTENEEAECSNS